MILKRQPCKCKGNDYKINYKGLGFLLMSSVECKRCHKKYPIKGALPYMSLQYVDVIFKVIIILTIIYYAILKWLPGIIYMVVMIFFLNYLMYPILFKLGIMMIDSKEKIKK